MEDWRCWTGHIGDIGYIGKIIGNTELYYRIYITSDTSKFNMIFVIAIRNLVLKIY